MEQPLSSIPENIEDYYGEDGLLYCGKCYTPKEAFFAKGIVLMGKNKHPVECCCQRMEREKQEALINQQKHLDLVRRLKAEGFLDPAMLDWTFENDNGRSPQMHHAHHYVEQWQTMRSENLGLLLWGGVGTGKSFLAGCIANALMEQEVPVRMTNIARILNELNGSFSGRNDIVDKLCRYPLLIIDDFGMERGTEYALEQILKSTKTASSCRTIFMTSALKEELKKWLSQLASDEMKDPTRYHDSGMLFRLPNGLAVEPVLIRKKFLKWQDAHPEFPRIVFHGLRHSSATYQLMISGGDVKAVQGTTGHATADMLVNTYAHIQQSSRVELGRKFEEGFYAKQESPSPQAVPAAGEPTISMTALLELLKNADPEVKAQLRLALLT